ncbi:MAG: hypothetical protein LBU64_14795 [Planctomycetota bacterium]|jgi:hypothetical protein|nr:hypothetical protein [Planctomycetota bacterium]
MTEVEAREKFFGAAWTDLTDACHIGDRPAAEKAVAELLGILNRHDETWSREDLLVVLGRRCVYLPPALAELEAELHERRREAEDCAKADLIF